MPLLNSESSVGCWVQTTKEATPVQGYNFRFGLLLWLLGTHKTRTRQPYWEVCGSGVFNPRSAISSLTSWHCANYSSLPVPQFLYVNEKILNKHKMWFASIRYSYQCDMMNSLFPSPFFFFLNETETWFYFFKFLLGTLRSRNRLSSIETKHPC